jgi:hypothetical protein
VYFGSGTIPGWGQYQAKLWMKALSPAEWMKRYSIMYGIAMCALDRFEQPK